MREYRPADARAGWAMGNVQQLADGGVFVGWGTDGSFSEFGPDGRLRFDARFVDGERRLPRLPLVLDREADRQARDRGARRTPTRR